MQRFSSTYCSVCVLAGRTLYSSSICLDACMQGRCGIYLLHCLYYSMVLSERARNMGGMLERQGGPASQACVFDSDQATIYNPDKQNTDEGESQTLWEPTLSPSSLETASVPKSQNKPSVCWRSLPIAM